VLTGKMGKMAMKSYGLVKIKEGSKRKIKRKGVKVEKK